MTLIESRVKDCFWLFGLTLPISKAYKDKMAAVFGEDISKQIPSLLQVIARLCIKNPEEFAGYLEFIGHAYEYCQGFRDDLPKTNLENEEYQEFIHDIRGKIKND